MTKTYTISYVYNDFALTPEASATVEEGKSYTVSNTHKDWLGYKFEGWKVNGVGEIVKVLENVQSDITLVASFVKDPTAGKYKVEHYWQNLDGKGYTRYETELKSGVADGTEVAAAGNQAKNYAGLKYDHCEGSSVASVYDENIQGTIKLYYTRNSYDVTYMVDGKQSGKVETYKFGQTVTLRDAPNAKKGYTFVGWEADHALGSGNTMPAADEQDAADIGEEETPLASGETGLGFNIIPFIILGIIIVAAAIYAYIRHKKQAGENA